MKLFKMTTALVLIAAGLATQSGYSSNSKETVILSGAGATFPYPLYLKWFKSYNSANPSVEINYSSVGSGAGIKQLIQKSIDFGASDAPMSAEEVASASAPVAHIPTTLGAVVVTYNLAEATKPLQLTADVVADLFLGKITHWNDEKIAALNPGVKLPKIAVSVVFRSDGSGTTAVFSDYMSKVSPEWKTALGQGKSLSWKYGIGGKGNEGVTGYVKQTPGAIGYVELSYAESNGLAFASLKNAAGVFVAPSVKSVSAAADGEIKTIPVDFKVSITNAIGKGSYPISSFTYLLVYEKMAGNKGKEFQKFLNWAMEDGQTIISKAVKGEAIYGYAPLPKSLITKVKAKVKTLQVGS